MLLLVVAVGGYFVWQKFQLPAETAATPAPVAKAPSTGPAAPSKRSTPVDALNALAHAPVNAIHKAQEAIAARRNAEQTRVDAVLDVDGSSKQPGPGAASKGPTPGKTTKTKAAVTNLAPGVSATTEIEAGADASVAFRIFVANAKVNGVFQGNPPRAFINGRMYREGEVVDSALGITFQGIKADLKQIIFKDRTESIVTRRY